MAGVNTYTKLLLHLNGDDGSPTIIDSSPVGRTVIANGTAQLDTSQKWGGSASLLLDGGSYVQMINSNDFNFGTENFTIDCRLMFSSLTGIQTIYAHNVSGNDFKFRWNGSNFALWGETSTILTTSGLPTINLGQWYHIALVRNGDNWQIYVDGISYASVTDARSLGLPNHINGIMIGAEVTAPSQFFNGWIDEFRVQKGEAYWTSNFTPPTEEYSTTIDYNTKLLLHGNGNDESQVIIDSSPIERTITANGTTQIDTAQKKFGSGSILFDGDSDYLSASNSDDWEFDDNAFTIECWIRFNFIQNCGIINYGYQALSGQKLPWGLLFVDNVLYFYRYDGATEYYKNVSWTPSIDTWYHLAITRSNNSLRFFINGVQTGTTFDITGWSYTNFGESFSLYIGRYYGGDENRYFNGWIDELRISKGIAIWTSNFTPPTEEYGILPIDEEATLTFSETVDIQEIGNFVQSTGILSISEAFDINQSLEKIFDSKTLSFSENAIISSVGLIETIFNTDLRTLVSSVSSYFTSMITSILDFNKFNTQLNLKAIVSSIFNTDLRVRFNNYNAINIGSLNDFIVKLDGAELTDVDYTSLRIRYSLNTTPSSATFILARRHDNFNYKLDGTSSIISNENKITVFDGTTKIFTGYITKINALSQTDTIQITAEDARYKLSRISLKLWYGGRYVEKYKINDVWYEEKDVPDNYNLDILWKEWIEDKRTIGQALQIVLAECLPYISGYETIPFPTSYIPEYVETEGTCLDLINTLITQTANANWYLDENELLLFQRVDNGQVKTIPLSSLTSHRHAYDAIISDIELNKQQSAYAKSLKVKLGTFIKQRISRREFICDILSNEGISAYLNTIKEPVSFGFQQWGLVGERWYCGIGGTLYMYYGPDGWILRAFWVIQSTREDSEKDLPIMTVGSGLPTRTLYLNSYGKKEVDERWEEQGMTEREANYHPGSNVNDIWLVSNTEEQYNYINYAIDLANFELNQNNKLQTTATVSLLLDAYKYYAIHLSDRINLSNTIGANIYNNNNGFPLNIDSVEIDCSTRVVTLSLTNYSKSWYVKTANYLLNYIPSSIRYLYKKEEAIDFSMNV
jgi:hypothetical protein